MELTKVRDAAKAALLQERIVRLTELAAGVAGHFGAIISQSKSQDNRLDEAADLCRRVQAIVAEAKGDNALTRGVAEQGLGSIAEMPALFDPYMPEPPESGDEQDAKHQRTDGAAPPVANAVGAAVPVAPAVPLLVEVLPTGPVAVH